MNTARKIRSCLVTLLATLTLVLPGVLVPTVAQAQIGDLECEAAFQFTFDPPLSAANLEEHAHVAAAVTNCVSPNQRFADIHSGNIDAVGTAVASGSPVNPCALLLTISGSANIHWSNQQTSHLSYVVNTDPANGTDTLSAEIQSGPMAGDTITVVPVVAIINLDCPLAGLKTIGASLAVAHFA